MQAHDGRYVDVAAPRRRHVRHGGFGHAEHALHVHGHQPVIVVIGAVRQGHCGRVDAGAVENMVDMTKAGNDGSDLTLHLVWLRHVQGVGVVSLAFVPADKLQGLAETVLAHIRESEAGAELIKLQGGGSTGKRSRVS